MQPNTQTAVAPAEDRAPSRRPVWPLLFLLPLTCEFVHRQMTIRPVPPGAQVLLEGEVIGFAPTSSDLTFKADEKDKLPDRSTQDILDRANALRQDAQLGKE